jgi:hypothetical protein
MMYPLRSLSILVAVIAVFIWIGDAGALTLTFVEPTDSSPGITSVSVTVDLGGATNIVNRVVRSDHEHGSLTFDFTGTTVSGDTDLRLVGLTQPGSTVVSDLLSVITSPGSTANTVSVRIEFSSDGEVGFGGAAPSTTIPETGALQQIFNGNVAIGSLSLALVALAQSDVDETTAVPEPGTLILLSSGLLSLGARCLGKRRARS